MAWSTPRTWVDGDIWKVAYLNAIRDGFAVLSTHQHSGAAGDGADINSPAFGS